AGVGAGTTAAGRGAAGIGCTTGCRAGVGCTIGVGCGVGVGVGCTISGEGLLAASAVAAAVADGLALAGAAVAPRVHGRLSALVFVLLLRVDRLLRLSSRSSFAATCASRCCRPGSGAASRSTLLGNSP